MFNKKQLILTILKSSVKAALVIAIAIVVILFSVRQIKKISASLEQKVTLNSIIEQKSETALKLKNDFEVVGDRDKKIEEALIPAENVLEFVGILENLATRHALQQTLRFSSPVPVESSAMKLSSIGYDVSLSGNIAALTGYLKDFEKLPYFTGISSVNLNTASPQGWNDVSTITIQAKIYVQ